VVARAADGPILADVPLFYAHKHTHTQTQSSPWTDDGCPSRHDVNFALHPVFGTPGMDLIATSCSMWLLLEEDDVEEDDMEVVNRFQSLISVIGFLIAATQELVLLLLGFLRVMCVGPRTCL
jgi:hypothetical protein